MGRMTSLTTVLEPIGIAQNSIEKHDFSYLYTRVTLMRTTSAPAVRTASSLRGGTGYPPKTMNNNRIGVNFPKFSFRQSLGKMFLQIDQHKIEN